MADSTTGALLSALKRQLKSRAINYADIATLLGVSQATVKRYLTGHGLTVPTLERIAKIAGLDLLSLVQIAQEQPDQPPPLTSAQETVLRSDRDTFTVYFLLSHGFTPGQISNEFGVRPRRLESLLVRLEKVGVIRRLATRIKVLTRTQFGDTLHGRINEFALGSARQFINEVVLRDEHCSWAFYSLPLSPASVARLREMMAQVVSEMRALSREEVGLSDGKREWYRLFAAIAPVNPKTVFRQR
jgi:transcriptional regulator with XRE-family HTH domain